MSSSRMLEVIPPLPQYAFMAWCSKHRDEFVVVVVVIGSMIA
jgi:hypothetical protein